jgi:hypothetical protein
LKKELREEIKQDEFASGLEKTIEWVAGHRDEVRIGAGVVVVLLAAAGAVGYFQGQRAREADQAFRDALTTFEAPVASELAAGADRPTGQVFATAEEKYKTAAAAFEGVERRFGSSKTGLRAKYYAALSRLELAQYPEAEKGLKEVQSQGAGLEGERTGGQGGGGVPRARHEPGGERAARLRAAERRADARGREAVGGGPGGVPAGVRGVPGERLRPRGPDAGRVPPEPLAP